MTSYTFESEIVTNLILGSTGWDPADLCEAVTHTIGFAQGEDCKVYIAPPEDTDYVQVTAPRRYSPEQVERMIEAAVESNEIDNEISDDDYIDAVILVVADVRESYPEVTAREAIAHVRNTVRLPEDGQVAGAWELEENGTPLALAYRAVLLRNR